MTKAPHERGTATRRQVLAGIGAGAAAIALAGGLAGGLAGALAKRVMAAGKPTVRLAALRYGSLQWLLETIVSEKLAEANGFVLDVRKIASAQAGPIALLSGEADVIVTDWPWAMRQRSKGEDVRFAPYSSALGAVMIAPDSQFKTLADLKGKRIGVAGSELDKSWIMLRAYAKKAFDLDLARAATPVYGAPPLLTEEMRAGRLDALLNFWTYSARLKGGGFQELIGMDAVMEGLGISPAPPMVGYVWSRKFEDEQPEALQGFLNAERKANEILKTSDAAFERLRGMMKAKDEAEFEALRATYRSGIPDGWTPAHTAAAEELLKLLKELGSEDLIGTDTKFDAKLFHGTA